MNGLAKSGLAKTAIIVSVWWSGTAALAAWANEPATTQAAVKAETSKPDAPKTVKVKREKVSPAFEVRTIVTAGDAVEMRYRPKAFAGELTIASILPHGAAVKAGDVVLKLESKNIARQLAEAENALANAKAAMAKEEFDQKAGDAADELSLRQWRQSVEQAEIALKYFDEIDGPQMLARTALGLKQYEHSIGDQDDELNQLKKMYKSEELTNDTADIVIKRALRQLEQTKIQQGFAIANARKVTENDVKTARQGKVDDLERARQGLAAAEAGVVQSKVSRATAVSGARLSLAAAETKLAELTADAAAMEFKAPADGRVYHGQWMDGGWGIFNGGGYTMNDLRTTRVGERVLANSVLVTVAPQGRWVAAGDLAGSRRGQVKPGQAVVLSAAGRPDVVLKGVVSEVSATPQGAGRGWEVVFGLDSTAEAAGLAYGTELTAYFDAPETEALAVPVAAVKRGTVTILKTDGTQEVRQVKLGVTDGKVVEVVSGLELGEEVVSP
jgi:multidrug resistance efflux pump